MTAKYASGEEPQVGDVVRFDGGDYHICALSGGVFAVESVMSFGGRIWIDYGPGYGKLNSSPRCFTLIARAGQPVEYLPGDVVECVEAFCFDGCLGLADQSVGDRFTVDEVIQGNLALNGLTQHDGRKARFAASRFRLVHRPDAPKVEEATAEAQPSGISGELPSKPIAEIARDLRPGQKVRWVTEGVVVSGSGPKSTYNTELGWISDPSITSLEIIEDAPPKPLAVGDRVVERTRTPGTYPVGEVQVIAHGRAAVDFGDTLKLHLLSELERAA